jgi:hypothetical protein
MSRQQVARIWFGVNALVVVVALAIQLPLSAGLQGTAFRTGTGLVINVFCYFTVQSNLLVAAASLLLALRLERHSMLFRVLRLSGLVGITVTFLVYHGVLAGLQELTGAAWVADQLVHTVSPLLCVGGWLLFGPRGAIDRTVLLWSLAFPACWSVFALIRGHFIDFYPYPFIDPRDHGYLRVAVNCVLVLLVFLAVSAAAAYGDRALTRRARG